MSDPVHQWIIKQRPIIDGQPVGVPTILDEAFEGTSQDVRDLKKRMREQGIKVSARTAEDLLKSLSQLGILVETP